MVQDPKPDLIENLVNSVKEKASYGEEKMISCSESLDALVGSKKDSKK